MQSYLQFRQAGLAATAQVKRGHEKSRRGALGVANSERHTRPANSQQPLETVSLVPRLYCQMECPRITFPISQRTSPTSQGPSTPSSSDSDGIYDNDYIEAAPEADITGDLEKCYSAATALGRVLTGVLVRDRHAGEGTVGQVFLVGWDGPDDRLNPRNWSVAKRVVITMQISLIGGVVGIASSIDAVVLPQAAEDLGVSEVAESMATGA